MMTPDDIKQAQDAISAIERFKGTSDYTPKVLGMLLWDEDVGIDHRPAIGEALSFYAKYLAVKDTHRFVPIEPTVEMYSRGFEMANMSPGLFVVYDSKIITDTGCVAIYKNMISASNDPLEE